MAVTNSMTAKASPQGVVRVDEPISSSLTLIDAA